MLLLKRILFSFLQKAKESLYNGIPNYGDVLMFHQINNDYQEWDDPNCSITLTSFQKLINSLIEQDMNFIPICDVTNNGITKALCITFDDAYMEVLTIVAPILVEKCIPFTVFVATDFLGKPKYLTVDALKALAQMPLCTIGSHTKSHLMLRMMSAEKAIAEITESKKILEDYTAKPVDYFAFPYGSLFACSRKNAFQVKSAGYKMGFSTLSYSLSYVSSKNRWFLPRRNINEKNYVKYI